MQKLPIVAALQTFLVRTERLELSHLAAPAPQAGVSTNSTTSATYSKNSSVEGSRRPRPLYFGDCSGVVAGAGADCGAGAEEELSAAGAGVEPAAGGAEAPFAAPGAPPAAPELGPVGAPGVVSPGAGAAPVGAPEAGLPGTTGADVRGVAASSRIVFGAACFVPMYASARLLIMKTAANTAVARDNAVRAPRAPNTVPEAPDPKPAPASAPLPR